MVWFSEFPWVIALAIFLGLFVSGIVKRKEPRIVGERVYRHDVPARVTHWTHALGTTVCLISGIILGLRFTPAFVADGPQAVVWMNVHFVACVIFLFGTFFYLGNTLISKYRFKEHMPSNNAILKAIHHYGHKLGLMKCEMPEEDKYFQSERIAYIMAIVVSVLLIVSGVVKTIAHVFLGVPDTFMNVITWVHDIAAALMLLFLLAHIFFGALIPWAWASFPCILTGWMRLDVAEEEHVAWMRKLHAEDDARAAAKNMPRDAASSASSQTSERVTEGN